MRQETSSTAGEPRLTRADEATLSTVILNPSSSEVARAAAVERLVQANRNIVFGVMRDKFPFIGRNEWDDAVAEGTVGLVKAALTFDASRGTKFVTWAYRMASSQIKKRVSDRPVVHIPNYDEVIRVYKFFANNEHGTVDDAAKELGIKRSHVQRARQALRTTVESIDAKEDFEAPVDNSVLSNPRSVVTTRDMVSLVREACRILGLGDEDVALMIDGGVAKEMARRRGKSTSTVRMLKRRLLWLVRRKVKTMVGADEYDLLSSHPVDNRPRASRARRVPAGKARRTA